nr:efflux RND transporter periplasmic adaptor subunit [Kofleriaceae bacterium]
MTRVVVLAAALAACARASDAPLATVTRDDLVLAVTATGTLAAVDSTDVPPPALTDQWSFKIASLVDEGTTVAVGDRIATFDTSDLSRELADLQIQLEAARKRLAMSRQDYAVARANDGVSVLSAQADAKKAVLENQQPAELTGAIAAKQREMQVEVSRMGVDEATSNAVASRDTDDAQLRALADYVTSSEHRVAEMQFDIDHMEVAASRAGIVVYTAAKVGATVYHTDSCAQIVGLGAMVARGSVDEVDIPRLAVDQPVTLRVDAMPDLTLHGHVQSIGTSVQPAAADRSRIVPLTIAVDPTPAALRPGMRFRARIETAHASGVVQVPADAVVVTAAGPVVVRDDGREQPVFVGRRSSDAIEIVGGVEPGDLVERFGDPATTGGAR